MSVEPREEPTEGALLELKLIGAIEGSFRVPRYQRGYRWGELEVKRLLDDIWESKGEPYNLQPIVVKADGEMQWELVDGQQRLTTLLLIFVFMRRERLQNADAPYSITYDTRRGSEAYLQELDAERAGINIDFFHLRQAYECISAWFEAHGTRRQYVANKFYGYLYESVRVIWYEAPPALNSTTLFTRLNVGRIPLTDAELFKALLLARSRGGPGISDRAHEIAAQWDGIERDLHDPAVWSFVADESATDSPTRITLLLDTLVSGPRGRARPRFHTFDVLRERMEERGAEAVWDEIVQLHGLVLGWYENRDHYHKVGYLVSTGHVFSDLVELAAGRTKSEFNAQLDARVRDALGLTGSRAAALNYVDHPLLCSHLLLLMNVETVRRLKDSTERYSFRSHRRQAWSLEHIHAQQAEGLTKLEQWKEWLHMHREAIAELSSIDDKLRDELLLRIDAVGERIDRPQFEALARDVAAAFTLADVSTAATAHSVHSLSNLALLATDHNSALSNAVFEVKRRRILELDRQGAYIPICTRHVFLKYYTDADAQQIHFWSTKDREAYLNTILSVDAGIGVYLAPEVPPS